MTTTIQLKIDSDLKKSVDAIIRQFGITTNDAIKMFLTTVKRTKSIPLDLSLPQSSTLDESVNEAYDIMDEKIQADRYSSFEEMHNAHSELFGKTKQF